MKKSLVILGSGGHARVILDAAIAAGWSVAGFLDGTRRVGEKINGAIVLGGDDRLSADDFVSGHAFIVAIGDNATRKRIAARVAKASGMFATVIHPSAQLSPSARIGDGTVVMARVVVNANATIGRCCIVNTGAIVEHDVLLEDGVQISPAVTLAGSVHCGAGAFIGAGAVVLPGIDIGAGTIIGAGAVVVRNAAAGVTLIGCPAREKPER